MKSNIIQAFFRKTGKKTEINSTVIEILLNISLAFMIMARSCMWIFYVKFYKKNYKYPTDKEGN